MRPTPSDFDGPSPAQAARVASEFQLTSPIEISDFPDKGNIHHQTYLIRGGGDDGQEFLLQQINSEVFRHPERVMASMLACIRAQERKLRSIGPASSPEWRTVELIPTKDGTPFLTVDHPRGRAYWRLMKRIPNCLTYKSLGEIQDLERRLHIAEETGRGLALFADLTSDLDVSALATPLPGYRDTRLYFVQLHSVLAGHRSLEDASAVLPEDPVLREGTTRLFFGQISKDEFERRRRLPDVTEALRVALEHEIYAQTLLRALATGEIRRVAVHGDTKLDNFLFDAVSGRVKSLIDLDTIMGHTWLSDWGDMVRSLANIAGERAHEPSTIQVDEAVFEAVARGFLGTVRTVTPGEVSLMVDAVRILALELGVRYLADYLRGDNYFRLGRGDPPDLNRIRAVGQLTLFQRLSDKTERLRSLIERWRKD